MTLDGSHSSLADRLQELVRADRRADLLDGMGHIPRGIVGREFEEARLFLADAQQGVEPPAQGGIVAADLLEVGRARFA